MMWWSVMPSTSMPAASSRALAARSASQRIDAQRDVIDPRRRVRRRLGGDVVAEVEEREVRAVGHAEEDVHVRAVLAGARHVVGADHVDERQAEHVLVEGAGLLAVAAAPGEVVQAADRDEGREDSSFRARAEDGSAPATNLLLLDRYHPAPCLHPASPAFACSIRPARRAFPTRSSHAMARQPTDLADPRLAASSPPASRA